MHNETTLIFQATLGKFQETDKNAGGHVRGKWEHFFIVDGIVDWCSHIGNQCGNIAKSKNKSTM